MRLFPRLAASLMVAGALGVSTGTSFARQSVTEKSVTRLTVEGMTCSSCAAMVALAAKRIDGVLNAEVTLSKRVAELTYDATRTDPSRLAAALSARTGYKIGPSVSGGRALTEAQPINNVSVADLRQQFNQNIRKTRLITILSPMCPACQGGQGAVARVFREVTSDRLGGFVIWLPMKAGDNAASAGRQAEAFVDARVVQGWDGTGHIGDRFARTLGLSARAWDVYAVYGPGIEWRGDTPPKPSFWTHQLTEASGADQAMCLNPATLVREVKKLVQGSDKQQP